MQPVQLHASDWEAGIVTPGFPIPPVGAIMGGRLEHHDPVAGLLRVSYATKPEYANPGGAVMGGLVAAFLDDCMGPLMMQRPAASK